MGTPAASSAQHEGCIVFCDVSGFVETANAHHLSFGPKIGAEKTRLWLDQVFDVILQNIENHNGQVLQFVGDAVVASFPKLHAANAALCAQQIKAQCQTIKVNVKTGIAAGPYQVFKPNLHTSPHVALALGQAIGEALEALKLAGASDAVCNRVFAEQLNVAQQVASTPSNFGLEPLPKDFYRIGANLSHGVLALPEAAKPGPAAVSINEIKLLTIVYIEVSLQANTREDSDWLSALCARFESIAQEHQATLSGLCQTGIGHRFQYFMGSSKSEINDVELAIQMASRIQEAAQEQSNVQSNLQVTRIAIGYGNAWQGEYGGKKVKLFHAHGREVNLAARILEHSEMGQICLTQSAVKQMNDTHHVIDQGEYTIKGESGPIRVFRVPGKHEFKPTQSSSHNPLYGRVVELAQVLELLKSHQIQQQPCLIEITGNAGIGKSTFVGGIEHALKQQGVSPIELRSSPHSKLLPYSAAYPLMQELGQLNRAASLETWLTESLAPYPALSQWLGLIGLITPLQLPLSEQANMASPEIKNQAIVQIFKALITQAVQQFKPVFVIEDLQWFDNSSVQLFTEAIFKAPGGRSIYTVRTSEGNSGTSALLDRLKQINPTTHYIQLKPFQQGETAQFLQNWFAVESVPTPLVDALHRLSEGNLLLLNALIQCMLEAGIIRKRLWAGVEVEFEKLEKFSAIPTNIEHALQARIDTLSQTHRLVLSHCSILKTAFTSEDLQAAFPHTGQESIQQIILELLAQRFIKIQPNPFGEDCFTFEHQVIEQCVYERIPFEERKALHAKFADWLESQFTETDPSVHNQLTIRLAAQYDWAGVLDKAVPLSKSAVTYAFEVGALAEASERLDKLIGWYKDGVLPNSRKLDLATLYEKKAQILYSQGRLIDALSNYIESLNALGQKTKMPIGYNDVMGFGALYLRRYLPPFMKRRTNPPTDEANLAIRIYTTLGEVYFFRGETELGNSYLLKGAMLSEKFKITTGEQAKVYSGCVIVSQFHGFESWKKYFKQQTYKALGEIPSDIEKLRASAYTNHRIGYTEYASGHFEIAYSMMEQSVKDARLCKEYQIEILAYSCFIFIRVAQGRFAEALAVNDTYEELARKYAANYFNFFHQYVLINQRVYCLAMMGRLAEARERLSFLEKIAKEFNFAYHLRVPMERCKLMVLYQEKDWTAARSQAMHLASLLTPEILNKAYYFTCYSLAVEVLIEADAHQRPLTMDEKQTLRILFKQLKRVQKLFELAKPIYLILSAQWLIRNGRHLAKAKQQLNQALVLATQSGQQVEQAKATLLLAKL
ncbi:MAG: AAA family ATPase [Limnobacter sp.]|nr:AAA family ATPase [Limnobacter sp.]